VKLSNKVIAISDCVGSHILTKILFLFCENFSKRKVKAKSTKNKYQNWATAGKAVLCVSFSHHNSNECGRARARAQVY